MTSVQGDQRDAADAIVDPNASEGDSSVVEVTMPETDACADGAMDPADPTDPADVDVVGALLGDDQGLTSKQRRSRRRAERKIARKERRATRSPLNKGIRRGVLVVALAFIALVGYSFVSALLKPTNDPIGPKAVGWFRDHNLEFVPNTIERVFYTVNAPESGGKLKGGIPTAAPSGDGGAVAAATAAATPTTLPRPVDIKPFVAAPEPNEGVWQPTGKKVDGQPVVYQTFIRPDATHTGQLVGLAWINGKRTTAALYNGTEEPGGAGWARGSKVEPADYGPLVATFNSGFKINGSLGGYFAEGRMVKPLVDGRASMIIKKDGTFTVGEWGRDAVMGPDIEAVRQNLSLLIDNGEIAPDVNSNFQGRWGATLGNSLYVWRSGVGIDKAGNVIYAGGPAMSVSSLAEVMKAAGAYRAMELDINTVWVSMHTYVGGENGAPMESFKLLEQMQRPVNRHLATGSRDFIAMFAKPAPPPPPSTTAPFASTTTAPKTKK
jgi:hypothetical protein